jgi:hypothetical protein
VSYRITIGGLLGVIALLAADCAIVRLCWAAPGERWYFYGVLLGLLPLINAALVGVIASIKGYRIKVRRKPAGLVPFWARFGLISLILLTVAVTVCITAPKFLEDYAALVESHLDQWLMGLEIVSGPVDYGPSLVRVLFSWALLSGPPLLIVCVLSWLSHRYMVVIEKSAS